MRFPLAILPAVGCLVAGMLDAAPGEARLERIRPTGNPLIPPEVAPDALGVVRDGNVVSLEWLPGPASFGVALAYRMPKAGAHSGPGTLLVGARTWGDAAGSPGVVFEVRFDRTRGAASIGGALRGPAPGARFGSRVVSIAPPARPELPDIVAFSAQTAPGWPYGAAWSLHPVPDHGPDTPVSWAVGHARTASHFGRPVARGGDINGDGLPDLVVGMARTQEEAAYNGLAAVFLGTSAGFRPEPDWSASGRTAGMRFGLAVNGVGDVNADGFDDIVVGAPATSNPDPAAGEAHLYLGGPDGPGREPVWRVSGGEAWTWFGADVVGDVDLNRDGHADVLVAAPGPMLANQRRADWPGKVHVFAGTTSGLTARPVAELVGRLAADSFGRTVCVVGDMDGDGRIEVAVGAHSATRDQDLQGAVHLFSIGTGFSVEPRGVVPGHVAREALGWSLAAGDLDGDGFPDLTMGAPFRQRTANNVGHGAVRVLWGGPDAFATSPRMLVPVQTPPPDPEPIRSVTPMNPARSLAAFGLSGAALCAGAWWVVRSRRRREQERVELVDQERRRIAQDLHDGVGSMVGTLAAIARRGSAGASEARTFPAEDLERLSATAERLADGMSEIVWMNEPVHDLLPDLVDRLSDHAVEAAAAHGFHCRLDLPDRIPPVPLPNAVRRDLYLAMREALHNAFRHSGGSTVTLSLALPPDRLELSVRDDGRGVPSPLPGDGNGLRNLRLRVERHGGHCRLEAGNPGTSVTLQIPIAASERR